MKDRGKEVAQDPGNGGDAFSVQEILCRVHPRASNVGVCSVCLKDRLLNLVCLECGEQRLSSCSCSDDLSSNRNSSCAYDVGSVGRISFLLENEKQGIMSQSVVQGTQKTLATADKSEEGAVLRRTSSSCMEIRRRGIWNLGKLLRRKKKSEKIGWDEPRQSELWVLQGIPISRSRSHCNFGGNDSWNFSRGRKSCYSEAEMRRSGFSESDMRKSCFSEASDTVNLECTSLHRRVFSLKESDYFGGMHERNVNHLRFSASESNSENYVGRITGDCWKPGKGLVREVGDLRRGSYRLTARDINYGLKKKTASRSFMGLRSIFRHNHHHYQLGPQQQQLQNPFVMSENRKR